MTGRIRQIIVLGAAACLLLASSRASSQTPPAGSDNEQRLKAIEDKMDRILKSLEARPDAQAGRGAAAIKAARDIIKADLMEKEKEREELVSRHGIVVEPRGATAMIVDALGKYEAKRSELRMSKEDMADQLARIEKAYKDGGPENGSKAAVQVIRAIGLAKGFDENPGEGIVAQLNQERQKLVAAHGENHSKVKDVDDAVAKVRKVYAGREALNVQAYINVMKEEISVLQSKIATLTNMIEQGKTNGREMNIYEIEEERTRREIDGLRNTLKGLNALLSGNQSQKPR